MGAIRLRMREVSERDNPLLRWASLKAKAAERRNDDLADSDSAPGALGSEGQFDPTSLPSIDSIAANTDVIAFLRAGVPAELTRAALRRAWTSDPEIRDFIGIAENQWDFNDPNGIPGFGPLAPAERSVDVLAHISNKVDRVSGTLKDLTAVTEPAPSNTDENKFQRHGTASNSPAPLAIAAAAESETEVAVGPIGKTQRHGSALPR